MLLRSAPRRAAPLAAALIALIAIVAACGADEPTLECLEAQDGSLVPASCDVEGEPTATPTPTAGASTGPTTQQLFVGTCGICHTINGLSTGALGPDLTQIGSRADADYIRQSIIDPNAVIAQPCPSGPCQPSVMLQNFGDTLSSEQIDALVDFLVAQQ